MGGISRVGEGGVVHRAQRGRESRFPKRRLARRTRIPPFNGTLAATAPHSPRCRCHLEKEPGKEEITVPGVSFCAGRRHVRLQT